MYGLYTLATVAAFVLASPYFLYQMARHRKYVDGFAQRLGRLPDTLNADGLDTIWLHAVSVGEVRAAGSLVRALKQAHPGTRVVLSTTTQTGQQVAREDHPDVEVFYFPFDLPWAVSRVLEVVRPRLLVLMETEIWPNVLRACRRRNVPVCLVNGRLSERSVARYRLVRPLFRHVLEDIDRFCAQDRESADRLMSLGADPVRVVVTGSLKFEAVEPAEPAPNAPPDVLRHFRLADGRPCIVAASTRRGEEGLVLEAFASVRTIWPACLLVLAPRHPERADEVVQLSRRAGFTTAKRSELDADGEPGADVVVLDTVGELARLYRIATVVFVGGSLVDWGGHNILEPAVLSKPIVFGPHMQNFADIVRRFLEAHAAWQLRSAAELSDALLTLLGDPAKRETLGKAAASLVEANRGALEATMRELNAALRNGTHP